MTGCPEILEYPVGYHSENIQGNQVNYRKGNYHIVTENIQSENVLV
jgi:hypothetical protein